MATVEVALQWVAQAVEELAHLMALAAEEVAHLMAQAAGDLQWEVQAVAVLLMEATEQEDDRLWEAPAREVDDLRWVDQETGLHPVEELPSPNFSKRHSII